MKDVNGKTYKYTTITNDGHIVHHNGTKALTDEQNQEFSELMSRVWDNFSEEKREEINSRILSRRTLSSTV